MSKRLLIPIAVLFLIVACISGPSATSIPAVTDATDQNPTADLNPTIDPAHQPYLPNPQMTPGDVLDVSITDICTPGYSSKVRNVPDSVKTQVYLEYGIPSHQPGDYEVDHLVSLELGGSNSIKNLWPEPYHGDLNAHVKDKLENKLHDMVCNGEINLESAQHEIATDWVAAYIKYIGQP
ncbi:MAG TPA: hypothetical protein VMC09_16670 [Anaerolineales bacterium]|nr:hypothetical protein [Anaerolineales bacterium]